MEVMLSSFESWLTAIFVVYSKSPSMVIFMVITMSQELISEEETFIRNIIALRSELRYYYKQYLSKSSTKSNRRWGHCSLVNIWDRLDTSLGEVESPVVFKRGLCSYDL